jgi:hypothetical protein
MAERSEFTVDTGRGYEIAGCASVDHDNGDPLDIVLSRADGQPFKDGRGARSTPSPCRSMTT